VLSFNAALLLPWLSWCFDWLAVQSGQADCDIPSFLVRLDSQKHIDFALSSPYGGGRPGRVKRRNQKAASKKASGGDDARGGGGGVSTHGVVYWFCA